jgi:deoxyhypusine synthase
VASVRLKRPVQDLKVDEGTTVAGLVEAMGESGGFSATKLAEAADVLARMVQDPGMYTFLSFPACVVATGARGLLTDMVRRGWVDCIVTTCGTLDHDIARTVGAYHHGTFDADDRELHRQGVHRLGNVFIKEGAYGPAIERFMSPLLEGLHDRGAGRIGTRELCEVIGRALHDERSLLWAAAEQRVPVYVPGISDGAVGSNLWMFSQDHRDLVIDPMVDERELSDVVFTHRRTGAVLLGGGISKHHVIWWNQFKDGLDLVVAVTTALEYDGSLSGARVREAVSWGKVSERARHVTLEADVTLALPLLVAAVADKVAKGARARKSAR